MSEQYKIVTSREALSSPCTEVSVEEGKEIGKFLLETLKGTSDGVGLAANQVGIDAAVCVINVDKPVVLVNPVVENSFFGEDNLLECVCVQHEIDHLNGITMFDRQKGLDKKNILEYISSKKSL